MRIVKQLALFIILYHTGTAQVRISGFVHDESKLALTGASVTIYKTDERKIIRFALTDANGQFSIDLPPASDSLHINVSMLGFEKKTMAFFPGKESSFSFMLATKPVVLKEVMVDKPPVWKKKDTLNYDAASFQQPQDRVIGDVIGRLPGIEVSPSGQIKYNGRPINKFYIEGLDLLEDKYGIATNNIPAAAIDKIQVLENHQPIKLLDSISFSSRAALNIKLKDDAKTKLVGRAKLGLGASPLLSENELMTMLFRKKLQFLNTYKFNNTGVDNGKELMAHNIGEYLEAVENGAIKNDLVAVVQPPAPGISETRYLFNNAHTISVNQLIPVSRQYQLRLNASYANDHRQQQSNTITRIFLPADTISINERNNFHGNYNTLQADLSLMANKPKYYFKNVLKFQGWWSSERNNTITHKQVDQNLSNPFYNLSNDLKLLWTKAAHIVQLSSYTGFVSLPQQLEIQPGLYENVLHDSLGYDRLIQNAALKVFYTDNYLGLTTRLSRFSIDHKLGFNIQSQQYTTYLSVSSDDRFQNELSWKRSRFYFDNSFSYENNKLKLRLSLPLSLVHFNASDPVQLFDLKETFFLINPLATITWQMSSEWSLNASAQHGKDFGDYQNMARGYVLKTYRNLSNNNAPLAQNRSTGISGSINFRNPVKIKFFHTGVRLSWKESNLLYSQQYNGSLETLIAMLQDNYSRSVHFFGRYSKYFVPVKTSIQLNYTYTTGKRELLQQHVLSALSNTSYSIGAGIKTKFGNPVSTDYTNNFFKYFSRSQLQPGSSLTTFNQNLVVNYFPAGQFTVKAGMEHYLVGSAAYPFRHYYFTDLGLRYTTKKSKTDYELSCRNIFNTSVFVSGFLSDNMETITEYQLRPRQFLIKANFSF